MALVARIVSRLSLSLLLMLCCEGGSFAQKRFALVIGNYNYAPSVGPLQTPEKDQQLISEALTDIKFDVVSIENATRTDIRYEVDVLSKKLERAGDGAIGFLYYSGHGAARGKVNYLIPVDAKEPQDQRFWYDAVPIDEIVKALTDEAPRASIFIVFDACRSELHLPTKSLGAKGFDSDSVRHTEGVVIAFSTGPNTTAPDIGEMGGVYARSLAAELVKPGQTHVELFQHVKEYVAEHSTGGQRPWIEDGLPRGLPLSASGEVPASSSANSGLLASASASSGVLSSRPTPSLTPPVARGPSEAERELERSFWESVRNSNSVAAIQAYLDRYPDGTFAVIAKLPVQELQRPLTQPSLPQPQQPQIEARLPPSNTLIPRTNQQASFNCSKPSEPLEQLICADAELAEWDGRMGSVYFRKRDDGRNRVQYIQQQRDWIARRDAQCQVPKSGDWSIASLTPLKPCILEAIKQRYNELLSQ
jgi:uncharacterized caspase-like protein